PPLRVSSPLAPRMASSPCPPTMVSSPPSPMSRSLPARPLSVSFAPLPQMMSFPGVPLSVSGALVPVTVQAWNAVDVEFVLQGKNFTFCDTPVPVPIDQSDGPVALPHQFFLKTRFFAVWLSMP